MKPIGLTLLLAAILLALTGLLVPVVQMLFLLFAAILYGIFCSAVGRWISRHTPMNYYWSVGVFLLIQFLLLSGGLYYLGASIVEQASSFANQIRQAAANAKSKVQEYGISTKELQQVQPSLSDASTKLSAAAQSMLWGLTGVVVIVSVGIYTALAPRVYAKGILSLFPKHRRDRINAVLFRQREAISRWIVGRIFSMIIVGICTAIGLSILGVPMAISLGVLAALLTFVPNVGPILAVIPQVLLALQINVQAVWWVTGFNLVLQLLESYLITPLVQQYEVSLPPALTIAVQLVFGVAFGVIGVIVAAPVSLCVIIAVQMLYIQDVLNDKQNSELGTQ